MYLTDRVFDVVDPDARFKLLAMPDCVHLDGVGRCQLLRGRECSAGGCSFACSEREQNASFARWKEHMRGLDPDVQRRLAERYYSGTRPWLDDGKEDD